MTEEEYSKIFHLNKSAGKNLADIQHECRNINAGKKLSRYYAWLCRTHKYDKSLQDLKNALVSVYARMKIGNIPTGEGSAVKELQTFAIISNSNAKLLLDMIEECYNEDSEDGTINHLSKFVDDVTKLETHFGEDFGIIRYWLGNAKSDVDSRIAFYTEKGMVRRCRSAKSYDSRKVSYISTDFVNAVNSKFINMNETETQNTSWIKEFGGSAINALVKVARCKPLPDRDTQKKMVEDTLRIWYEANLGDIEYTVSSMHLSKSKFKEILMDDLSSTIPQWCYPSRYKIMEWCEKDKIPFINS